MAIDRREDAGEFYPGGKTISTQPVKGGGDMKHEDFADVAKLPDRFNDTMIHDKLNEVIGLLKGPVAAFALTLALDVLLGAFSVQGADVTVQTAPKGAVFNDEQIVTNVVFDATGLATPEMVTNIVQDVSPVPDFSPSNATLVATIEATAPAPGNYATVSNAAMTALQSYTETDPTVPSWAKAATKPGYTASEVGAYSTGDVDVILQDYLPLDYFKNGQTIPMYWGDGTKLCDFGANWLGNLVSEVGGKPDADDIPPAVSNIVTEAFVENLGVVLEETDPTVPQWAKSQTQPLPPDYSNVSNKAMTALQSYTETDPTVPAWAKASSKPTYTASEVGAVPTSRTVNSKALSANISLTASDVGATTTEDVYRIVAGTNIVLVVTNYNSATHAPAMKLQHLDPQSGEYVTYWDETRRHGLTLTNAMDYTDAAAAAELSRADAAYAPRAWSGTTSGLGAEAPAGVTWISTPETVIAGGYEYEKVITSSGAVWVLSSNGLTTGATTNAFFRVTATDGTELFAIEKTDSFLIGVNPDGITRVDNTVTIPVNVVADAHPYIRATTNLVNAVWTKEDENGFSCPWATVSWSGTTGAYVATVTCSEPLAFFYFEYLVEGGAKIKNSATVEMTGGIYFNGYRYMPVVNGSKLEFIRQ